MTWPALVATKTWPFEMAGTPVTPPVMVTSFCWAGTPMFWKPAPEQSSPEASPG